MDAPLADYFRWLGLRDKLREELKHANNEVAKRSNELMVRMRAEGQRRLPVDPGHGVEMDALETRISRTRTPMIKRDLLLWQKEFWRSKMPQMDERELEELVWESVQYAYDKRPVVESEALCPVRHRKRRRQIVLPTPEGAMDGSATLAAASGGRPL